MQKLVDEFCTTLDDQEKRVFALQLEELTTGGAFVEALGLTDQPEPVQRRAVNKVKDRLHHKLRRFLGKRPDLGRHKSVVGNEQTW